MNRGARNSREIAALKDAKRLQDKLAKLAARENSAGPDGREIKFSDASGSILSLLHIIDDTLLAREVLLVNDTGRALGMEISNRRLLRVSDPTGRSDISAFHKKLGQPFSQAGPEIIKALHDLLCDFLASAKKLTVSSSKLTRVTDVSEIGLSCEALAQAWSVDLYETDHASDSEKIENFVSACDDVILASVAFDAGDILEKSGPDAEVNQLVVLARTGLAQLDKKLTTCFHHAMTAFLVVPSLKNENLQSLAYAGFGENRALMLVADEHMSHLLSVWRKTVD